MNKIPVGRTISSAYAFTFGHVGAVIGLIWLPLLIYYVGRFFIVNYAQSIAAAGDPTSSGRAVLVLIGFWFVSVFFTAIIGVAVTRQVLTPKEGNILVYIGFGQAEFNYFLSLLAVFAVMLAVYIIIAIVAAIVGGIVGAFAAAAGGAAGADKGLLVAAVVVPVAALSLAALVYVGIRLMFLVAPVTLTEGKVDLIRAWQLARGNFWRMLGIVLVTVGPIVIVAQLAFAAIVGPAYVIALLQVFLALFKAIVSGIAPPSQLLQHLPDISSKTPMLLGVSFLLAPFTYGLLFSAPAFAYRALAGGTTPAARPDMGPFRPA